MRRLAFLWAITALCLGGCASYQMGEPVALPYKSIKVAPPKNFSTLPQIEGPLNAALRQAIQKSGALELSTGSTADAQLELSVLETKRNIAAVSSADVGRGRKFELVTDLELSLRKLDASGQYFIESRLFSIKQDIYTDEGQVDAEYQAMPEITRQISEHVVEILVDLW